MTAALDGMNYRAKDKDVCVSAYLYEGMRVALREAIVRVIICNSPIVKTCWLTEAADPGHLWHLLISDLFLGWAKIKYTNTTIHPVAFFWGFWGLIDS